MPELASKILRFEMAKRKHIEFNIKDLLLSTKASLTNKSY